MIRVPRAAVLVLSAGALLVFGPTACGDRDKFVSSGNFTVVELGPSEGALTVQLGSEAGKARAAGRKPFVEFYATWCAPCKALTKHSGDPLMVDAFDGVYLIRLDIDAWKYALAGTGFSPPGVPMFYELDGQGRPTGKHIDGGVWGEDVPANMAPPLKAFFHPQAS